MQVHQVGECKVGSVTIVKQQYNTCDKEDHSSTAATLVSIKQKMNKRRQFYQKRDRAFDESLFRLRGSNGLMIDVVFLATRTIIIFVKVKQKTRNNV